MRARDAACLTALIWVVYLFRVPWSAALVVVLTGVGVVCYLARRRRTAKTPAHGSTCGCARCTNEMYQRYGRYR